MAGRPNRRAHLIAAQPEVRRSFASPGEAEVFVETVRAYGFPAMRTGREATAYAPANEIRWAEAMVAKYGHRLPAAMRDVLSRAPRSAHSRAPRSAFGSARRDYLSESEETTETTEDERGGEREVAARGAGSSSSMRTRASRRRSGGGGGGGRGRVVSRTTIRGASPAAHARAERLAIAQALTARDASARDRLTYRERQRLPDRIFALPERRALPVHDAAHVRNAAARLQQMWLRGSISPDEYYSAKRVIERRKKKLGIGEFRRDPAPESERSRRRSEARQDERFVFPSANAADIFVYQMQEAGYRPRRISSGLVAVRAPDDAVRHALSRSRTYARDRKAPRTKRRAAR